ncbi:hypothetical protein ACFWD9_37895 [Streptomyces anthocyanicus]
MPIAFSMIADLARQVLATAGQAVSPELMDEKTAATYVATVFAPVAAALLFGAIASVGLFDRAIRNGGKRRTTLPMFLILLAISVTSLTGIMVLAAVAAYNLLPEAAQVLANALSILLVIGIAFLSLLYVLIYVPSESGKSSCGFQCVCGEACPCDAPCPSGQSEAGRWRRKFSRLPWVSPTPPPYMRAPFDGTAWGNYEAACGRSCRCGRPCPCSAPCPCEPPSTTRQRALHQLIRDGRHPSREHGAHNHGDILEAKLTSEPPTPEVTPRA